jgi:hypothetical protein
MVITHFWYLAIGTVNVFSNMVYIEKVSITIEFKRQIHENDIQEE